MLFRFKLFVILYVKSIIAYPPTGIRWSLRHIVFLVVFPVFYIGLQVINRICFLLDDLFFYEYRGIEVRSPVFILGFPRSGTTHLHRLFAKDDQKHLLAAMGDDVRAIDCSKKIFPVARPDGPENRSAAIPDVPGH